MKKVTLTVEDYLYDFYKKIGAAAGGLAPEKVMADALFKFAGGAVAEVQKSKNEKK